MMKLKANKPYSFQPPRETLESFRNASPEAKLNWLEEARRFVFDFVPPVKLELWRKISKR